MFIDTYLAIPLWTFAIFGFIYFVLHVFDSLASHARKNFNKDNDNNICILAISAKDQEEDIEGLVRCFIGDTGQNVSDGRYTKIVLIDLNSRDMTPMIMERLSRKYSQVKMISIDDLEGNLLDF